MLRRHWRQELAKINSKKTDWIRNTCIKMVLFISTQDEEYVGLLSSPVVSSPAHVTLDKKRIKAFLKGYQLK